MELREQIGNRTPMTLIRDRHAEELHEFELETARRKREIVDRHFRELNAVAIHQDTKARTELEAALALLRESTEDGEET